MAQYKVPQDVEADDKLLGPFSFRQFVYLLIAGILVALGVALFQIFPLLAIIPLPPVLLLVALALPLKKDQPMETYLAAVVSYYTKPRIRTWMSGQKESTITITAPKIVDSDSKARNITSEEATHRLSFLADIVDTGGYAIKGIGTRVNAELVAEATAAHDMFESNNFTNIENAIERDNNQRHSEVVQEMKQEIARAENIATAGGVMRGDEEFGNMGTTDKNHVSNYDAMTNGNFDYGTQRPNFGAQPVDNGLRVDGPNFMSPAVVKPTLPISEKNEKTTDKVKTKVTNPSIMELANNTEYSVATIEKEANRIKERDEGEVFISLH